MFTIEKEAIRRATERLRADLGENLLSVIAFGSSAIPIPKIEQSDNLDIGSNIKEFLV